MSDGRTDAATNSRPDRSAEVVDDLTLIAPPNSVVGEPGERHVRCIEARKEKKGKSGFTLVLTFEERATGRVVCQWLSVPNSLAAISGSKLWRAVILALGREPQPHHPLDLGAVFVGRSFRAFVGYRKTPQPKGNGKARDELAYQEKPGDYLRVHELLERLE